MNDDYKIRYTFFNKYGENVQITFTISEIEGAIGGFIKQVQDTLNIIDFGEIDKFYRIPAI